MTGIKETTEVVDAAFTAFDFFGDIEDMNWLEILPRLREVRDKCKVAKEGIQQVPGEMKDLDQPESEELGRFTAGRMWQSAQKWES